MLKSFRELEVWQKAHALTLEVYGLAETFPECEPFGVVAQWRRSASSVPANIAEGFGRLLLLSRDLYYLEAQDYQRLDGQCSSIAQMMSALARSRRNGGRGSHGPQATGHGAR